MASQQRTERVGEAVQQCLAQIISREIEDPRLKLLTLTGVNMSRDLAHAKLYFTLPEDSGDTKAALKALEKAQGFLRRRLGEEVSLRITPTLTFFPDPAAATGSRIDRLLRDM